MKGRPVICSHCWQPGHLINACHIKADGRRIPDPYDLEALALVAALDSDRKGRVPVVEARRHIARALRRQARRLNRTNDQPTEGTNDNGL